jgi:hypothetical protein
MGMKLSIFYIVCLYWFMAVSTNSNRLTRDPISWITRS